MNLLCIVTIYLKFYIAISFFLTYMLKSDFHRVVTLLSVLSHFLGDISMGIYLGDNIDYSLSFLP